MKTITTSDLKSHLDSASADFHLVNVLPAGKFTETLIPGAQNIPLDEPDFAPRVESAIGGKAAPVTLYCGSRDCSKSKQAAQQLEAAGFTSVQVYDDGARGWQEQTQQAAMNVGS